MKKREDRVGVADAKRQFSDLLGRVAYGKERITIMRRGRPMARLVPAGEEATRPRLADARGWLEEDDPFFAEMTLPPMNIGVHRARRSSRCFESLSSKTDHGGPRRLVNLCPDRWTKVQ